MSKLTMAALLTGLLIKTAQATDLELSIELPRLDFAEYHRPYVAIWIENADQDAVSDLAVWYDVAKKNNEGAESLKDMHQWWRRSGCHQTFPVDGVSGTTKPVGTHALSFSIANKPFAQLKPAQYTLAVEAEHEVGGRELVRIPFE